MPRRRPQRRYCYAIVITVLVSNQLVTFWLDVWARHWTRAVSAAHLMVQRRGFCVLRTGVRS